MGKRGPKRTPTAVLVARGSWRGRERSAVEPEVQAATNIDPPDNLDDEAKTIWRRVVKELQAIGIMGEVDRESLYCYVEACREFDKAVQELKKGYLYKDAVGNVQKSPWIAIKRDAAARIKQFAAEFGLTPASRSNVKGGPGEKPKEKNKPKASDFIKIPFKVG